MSAGGGENFSRGLREKNKEVSMQDRREGGDSRMYHRPYLRKAVIAEVKENAQRDSKGRFLDANTHQPIEGKYNIGHKYSHEYWREAEKARAEDLTQKEFNDRMNNSSLYQLEDEHSNKSHAYEMPREPDAKPMISKKGNTKAAMAGETSKTAVKTRAGMSRAQAAGLSSSGHARMAARSHGRGSGEGGPGKAGGRAAMAMGSSGGGGAGTGGHGKGSVGSPGHGSSGGTVSGAAHGNGPTGHSK